MVVQRATPFCLLISLVLHAALVALGASAVSHADSREAVEVLAADPWVGETFDVETLALQGEHTGPVGEAPAGVPPDRAETKAPQTTPPQATPPVPTHPATEPPTPAPTRENPALPRQKASAQAPAPPAASGGTLQDAGAPQDPTGESPGAGRAGAFGAAGRPGGVRNLATAFARAMPMANSADPAWVTMPLGPAGALEVTLEVDDAGKIVGATPKDPTRAPEHLVRLVERTLILLRAGRFSLSQVQTSAGKETFLLEARIDQVEVNPDEDPSQAGPVGLGFQAPQPGVPGHATFTLRSGRRVDITVALVR